VTIHVHNLYDIKFCQLHACGSRERCNVANYDLGNVRLKPMQSAVSLFTVRDLRGGPLEICRAVVSHCIALTVLPADRCGSFALCIGKSLRILVPSRPSLLVAGL